MKFADIKPGDPWFRSEETRALVAAIAERRSNAIDSMVNAVRKNAPHGSAGLVGAADAYQGILFLLQPRESEK